METEHRQECLCHKRKRSRRRGCLRDGFAGPRAKS